MKKEELWIVKAGSQVIVNGGPLLIQSWMSQVSELLKNGIRIVWVSSGAIASAKNRTRFRSKKPSLIEKQALSAIGQPFVMDIYNVALARYGLLGAQILLTSDDIKNRQRATNLKNSLGQLLKWNVIPILNENDAVSTAEIKFGDNDQLASRIAVMMKAKRLILLSDVDGLYERDPKRFPNSSIVRLKGKIEERELKLYKKSSASKSGTGGIYSKILAAQLAQKNNIQTCLAKGDHPDLLLKLLKDQEIGTSFVPYTPNEGRNARR